MTPDTLEHLKPGKFRKKPIVVEAIRVPLFDTSDNEFVQFSDWLDAHNSDHRQQMDNGGDGSLEIYTLEGVMRANPGDWVIQGVKGEFYPCKPDIFEATYEPASTRPREKALDEKLVKGLKAMRRAISRGEMPEGWPIRELLRRIDGGTDEGETG